MKFYCDLRLSDILIPKKPQVIADIEARRPKFGHYLIVLSDRSDENLEIHPSNVLSKHVWKDKEWFVVGVAVGYQEALRIVQALLQEVYDKTGTADIREYILEQQIQLKEGE